MKVVSNLQVETLSTGDKYYLLLIMLWVVSIAGFAQELPSSQENPVEQVRSLMNSYLFESDEAIMYRIRDVVEQSGLNELTETAREHLVKANIYLEKQQYKNSIEEYQQVIVDSPWVFDAFFNLAHIYAADIQYTKAIETMQNYLVFQPQGARSRQAKDAIYTWEIEVEEELTMNTLENTRLEGVTVVDADVAELYEFLFRMKQHFEKGTRGVIISEVDQGSLAWQAGMREGDLILFLYFNPGFLEGRSKIIEFSNAKEFADIIKKHNDSLPHIAVFKASTYKDNKAGSGDSGHNDLRTFFEPSSW